MNFDKTYFGDVEHDVANPVLDSSRLKTLVDPVPKLEMLKTKISHVLGAFSPESMLAVCYANLTSELDTLKKQGFIIYVFEQVRPAQEAQVQKIEHMNSKIWGKDINEKLRLIELDFPVCGRISRAALFEISWSSLFDAVLYCNKYYSWTSIFLSKKEDFFAGETLKKIIRCGNFEIDSLLWFAMLNKGAICGGMCEDGTIVIRSDGGFGDKFAEIQLVGVKSCLAQISSLRLSVSEGPKA